MASDSDDTIRAKVLRFLDRNGVYYPRHKTVEQVTTLAGIAGSDEGRAKDLTHEMAREDSYPVRFRETDETVCLEVDSQRWVASRIQSLDADALTWDQRERL